MIAFLLKPENIKKCFSSIASRVLSYFMQKKKEKKRYRRSVTAHTLESSSKIEMHLYRRGDKLN